jgi:uncharacterized protein YcfL
MRKLLPIFLSALMFTGCAASQKQENTYRQISMEEAVQIAGDFTLASIQETYENPAHWYGVKFETVLPWLAKTLFE